jgi:hypothetical protein
MTSLLPLLVDSYGSGTSSRLVPVSRDVLEAIDCRFRWSYRDAKYGHCCSARRSATSIVMRQEETGSMRVLVVDIEGRVRQDCLADGGVWAVHGSNFTPHLILAT